MWSSILDLFMNVINSCFNWFDRLMSAIPGAWDTIFTLITIIIITRFILKPLVGSVFNLGSDKVKVSIKKKEDNV